jgi:hypothetical protein
MRLLATERNYARPDHRVMSARAMSDATPTRATTPNRTTGR